jgi:hypothetical protein
MVGKAGWHVGGRGRTGRSAATCKQEGGTDGSEQAQEKTGAERHRRGQAGGRRTKRLRRRRSSFLAAGHRAVRSDVRHTGPIRAGSVVVAQRVVTRRGAPTATHRAALPRGRRPAATRFILRSTVGGPRSLPTAVGTPQVAIWIRKDPQSYHRRTLTMPLPPGTQRPCRCNQSPKEGSWAGVRPSSRREGFAPWCIPATAKKTCIR